MMTSHGPDHKPVFEPLEPRMLLSADFQGFVPTDPILDYDNLGQINYDASTDQLSVEASPLAFSDPANGLVFSLVFAPRQFLINIEVDDQGDLLGGVVGDDLFIEGNPDLNGDFIPDGLQTLLTGEIVSYAPLDTGSDVDRHEFIFEITGGSLASRYTDGFVGVTMTSEQSDFVDDFTVNFSGGAKGFLGSIPAASLGDRVWNDVDHDGIQDDGEAGVENAVVTLLTDADNDGQIDDVVAATTTGVDGLYSFADLTPGREYVVEFTLPTGFDAFTQQDAGSDDALDSDADLTTGRSGVITLASGENNTTIDAGVVQFASLGDLVWRDSNTNGIQDSGELGIEGVLVELLDEGGAVIATTTTNADGLYSFDDLLPGVYATRIADSNFNAGNALEGLYPTLRDEGADDAVDSDGQRNSPFVTDATTLISGAVISTLDFGFFSTGIALEKSGPDTAAPGETIEYVFTVTNTGDADLQNVVIDDPVISALPIVVGDLASGETKVVTQSYTVPTSGPQTVIDFDTDGVGNTLAAGTIIDDEYAAYGLTVTSNDQVNHPAMIFDSSNPTGGDTDLGTPHNDFGGPGVGIGGAAGAAGENNTALGNILIISEDGDQLDPDDDAHGGSLIFTFDTPQSIASVSVLDVDGNEAGSNIQVFDGSGFLLNEFLIAALSDNSFQKIDVDTVNVSMMKVNFVSSGAVTEIVLNSEVAPITNTATVTGDPVDPEQDLPDVEATDDHIVDIFQPTPGIDLEKLTNGIDADSAADAPEIEPGEQVTWTYRVTNTGNVAFHFDDVNLIDDNGTVGDASDDFTPTFISGSDDGNDDILSPGETWLYEHTAIAGDLGGSAGGAATLDLTGSSPVSGTAGNILTFTNGEGLFVNASAFSADADGNIDTAYLGSYSHGLGVTDGSETGGNGTHRVDNIGQTNYILFEFSETVVLDKALLEAIVHDSDISLWIGNVSDAYTNHQTLDADLLEDMDYFEANWAGCSRFSRWADVNSHEVAGNVIVLAASTKDATPEDAFKVSRLVVNRLATGVFGNIAQVTAPGAMDVDASHFTNPEDVDDAVVGLPTHTFDGVDDYLVVAHENAFKQNYATIAFTFATDDASQKQGLISKDARGYGDGGHMTIFIKKRRIYVRLQSTVKSFTIRSPKIQSNVAYDVAFTYGRYGMNLYVNGDRVAHRNYRGGMGATRHGSGNTEDFVIGADASRSNEGENDNLRWFFQGTMEDIRFVDEELRGDQIDLLFSDPDNDMFTYLFRL